MSQALLQKVDMLLVDLRGAWQVADGLQARALEKGAWAAGRDCARNAASCHDRNVAAMLQCDAASVRLMNHRALASDGPTNWSSDSGGNTWRGTAIRNRLGVCVFVFDFLGGP